MVDNVSFSDLVHEAFISPLRSVLIVDDQYPTWEEVLNSKIDGASHSVELEKRSSAKRWQKNASEPLNVIREFRASKPGFVIDIHDALAPVGPPKPANDSAQESETVSELADHLHQSDLLVLDYNLEDTQGALRGVKAREILKMILVNRHFNLVIVHTGEDDLEEVMSECLISLMQSCTSQFTDAVQISLNNLDVVLDDLEISENFDRSLLSSNFSVREYLALREASDMKSLYAEYMQGKGVFAQVSRWGSESGLKGGNLRTFLTWVVREFEKGRLSAFSETPLEGLCWRSGDDCKWMRSSRGFVTFVKKGPEDLLGELQKALEDWKPTPSRLLSAKYRYSLSSVGVEAEDRSLLNAHVFAQFYDDILEPAREGISEAHATLSREFKFKQHVARQSESVSFVIEDEIVEFGERIIRADALEGSVFSSHYGIDLKDLGTKREAVDHYNSYVSTLPIKNGSDQLDSGHIFKIGNDWWVCATPACDLQPGQNSIAFVGNSDDLRPFTAIQLVEMKRDSLENDHINSGSCCFIFDDAADKVICLGLRSFSDEQKPATQKVTWRTFLAKRQGLITERAFGVVQIKLNGSGLDTSDVEARILGKLRYEYALNYIQRVGSSVSRIGLGYAGYPLSKEDLN